MSIVHLTIFHTSDEHGRIENAARVAGLVRQAEIDNPGGVALFSSGDFFEGSAVADLEGPQPSLDILNASGYSAAALGNHDFDLGADFTRQWVKAAKPTILAANVIDARTGALLPGTKPSTTLTLKGVKLGILGLTTPDTATHTFPGVLKSIRFTDPVAAAKREVEALHEKGVENIFVLSHLGNGDDQLADQVPHLQILGGHTHEAWARPKIVNQDWITHPGAFRNSLTRIDMDVDTDTQGIVRETSKLIPIESDDPQDPQVAALATAALRRAAQQTGKVLGTLDTPLQHEVNGRDDVGPLLTRAMLDKTGVDVALVNGQFVRQGLPAGRVTEGQLMDAMPAQHRLQTATVPAGELAAALGQSDRHGGENRLVTAVASRYALRHGHLVDAGSGVALPDNQPVRIVASDFLLAGGLGFFTPVPNRDPVQGPLRDVFAASLHPASAVDKAAWPKEIADFAAGQPPSVAWAMHQILSNAKRLAALGAGPAGDELKSTLRKIHRAQADPAGALRRERLDAPIANFGDVVPGHLYRGAQPSAEGLRWLHKQGIKTIVLLREQGAEDTFFPGYSRADYLRDIRSLGMRCVELPMENHTLPTSEQIQRFNELVDQGENQPVYVHCMAGIGRTGAMCAMYLKSKGVPAQDLLAMSRRYGLEGNPIQMSFMATYPVGPAQEPALAPRADTRPNPVREALSQQRGVVLSRREIGADWVRQGGRGYLIDPQQSAFVPPLDRHPSLALGQALQEGTFVTLNFKSPQAVDQFASMARVLPVGQKMGCAALQELDFAHPGRGGLTLGDVDRARHLLGEGTPFEVSCQGLTHATLTAERIDKIAAAVTGHATVVDFNLPDGENPPPALVRRLWEQHGLATLVRISSEHARTAWDAQGVPYVGVATDPRLATSSIC